ncbi:MAG: aminotransferase class V-fold PLP-dependent enzyme [Pseudobacteriovorax sp.]|nr:aminotransferase class V-fold PLP-dependent enzyme [Pseudobacteriovorax sp.]
MEFKKIIDAQRLFSPETIYLNSATLGLPPLTVKESLERVVGTWYQGKLTAPMFDQPVENCRQLFAKIINVPCSWVSINSTVSQMVGTVVNSLDKGSVVLTVKNEFTSLLFPLLQKAQCSEIMVREVKPEDLIASIDSSIDMVAVSAAQSVDGTVINVDRLVEKAKAHGCKTLIDGTQAIGWYSQAWQEVDYLVAAAYKWLLCPRGVAFMSVRPEFHADLLPDGPSWFGGERVWDSIYGSPLRLANDARKCDASPAWFSWIGAEKALELIHNMGPKLIGEYNVNLANRFLNRIGYETTQSAIISVNAPGLCQALAKHNIVTSERLGSTRISFHFYNTEKQVDTAAEFVSKYLQ